MVLVLTIAMKKKVWWHSSAKNIFDTECRFVSLRMRACECTVYFVVRDSPTTTLFVLLWSLTYLGIVMKRNEFDED